jgi:membrane peptidoglycan carboxypeptidase
MLDRVVDAGLFTIYDEKTQAGLRILDRDNRVLFSSNYPTRVYPYFEAIPPLVLSTLLFIENRELLDERHPHLNPAVEWDRFGLAGLKMIAQTFGADIDVPGGSTLATQLEKYRHSPGGRTDSVTEKIRQMGSASLRAYLSGPDTRQTRRAIALAYLNSMPLAGAPNHGEVHGLGDGLWAWYGSDFATINRLLSSPTIYSSERINREQAKAYRQVLSLLLSQRRPAYYLGPGYVALQALADSYLRLLAAQGVIPASLRDAALEIGYIQRRDPAANSSTDFAEHKIKNVLRARLAGALGVKRLYDLDRLDLTARTTIDQDTQELVTQALKKLRDPAQARAVGLMGDRLLRAENDLDKIVYSLMLFERSARGNLLRVQTDNYDQPLDINEGIRLDLGSTAKLRTLVHYLELIADLHQQYADQSPEALRKVELHPRDRLSRWVIDQLLTNPHVNLRDLLTAALERSYSASSGESFFTGGGLHSFANFSKADSGKVMSLRAALRDSVNLVFIRLMRDLVYHHLYKPEGIARWLEVDDGSRRHQYLERFADREGQAFLRRFYAKYRGKTPQEAIELLTQSVRPAAKRLATVYRSLYPEHDTHALADYLRTHQGGPRVIRRRHQGLV